MGVEKENMLAGRPYQAYDPELVAERKRARRLCREYNATTEEEPERRVALLTELLGAVGGRIEIEPPFQVDYGAHLRVGPNCYMNFGAVILDCAAVTIGRNFMAGPGVHLYAATHPLVAAERVAGPERALPITIGDDVWLGGGTLVCPGVTIGSGTTIGAGSVVTKDVPANVFAAGNPCRVIRSL